MVHGRNAVWEALEEGLLEHVWVDAEKRQKFAQLEQGIKQQGIRLSFESAARLARMSVSARFDGVVAEVRLPDSVSEDVEDFDATGWRTVLALDGVTDTGNLGSILRSAVLFGADAVLLPMDNSAPLSAGVVRASAGALYQQRILYVRNLKSALRLLQERGFACVALTAWAEQDIGQAALGVKHCWVVGGEKEGIRKGVRKLCAQSARIPTTARLDSLNVSVAVAVALYESFQRTGRHAEAANGAFH